MRPASHLGLVLAGVALVPYQYAAPAPTITNDVVAIRFWSLADVTRVAVETTAEFEFKSDRVSTPDRLFFDFAASRLRMKGKGQHTIAVGDPLLKQIRVAETQPGTIRVVFDLEAGVEHTASQLTNPSRLIVELRPTGARSTAPLTSSNTGSRDLTQDPPPPSATPIDSKPAKLPQEIASVRERKTAAVPAVVTPVPTASVPAPAPAPPLPKQTPKPIPDVTAAKERVSATIAASPRPASLPKNGDHSLTRVLGLKVGRIVIDAGHGGHDTGTNGPSGLLEKDLVLDVAKRLGDLVQARMGSEVIYTRTDDTFIPLERRTAIANEHKADLFISIHANSSPAKSSSGVETYYLNFTTSQSALEVAARENASSQTTVYELKDLLEKIALKDKLEESRAFAAKVQTALYSFSVKGNPRSRDRGVKKAPFVVLIGASMPSVLVEIGFVSNPREEMLMKKADYRQKVADALFKGLSQYASTLSHFQVAKRD